MYYQVWIRNFAQIAELLLRLMKKDVEFEWRDEQGEAIVTLKEKLTSAPALKPIEYDKNE